MIANKFKYKVEILPKKQNNYNFIDFTEYVVLPIIIQEKLDLSLDIGNLKLANTNRQNVIEPFSLVKITITQGDIDMVKIFSVADDNVIYNISTDTYTHEINFIECTKLLERIVCDTKTFTQPLAEGIDEQTTPVYVVLRNDDGININDSCDLENVLYRTPLILDSENRVEINIQNPRTFMIDLPTPLTSGVNIKVYGLESGNIYSDANYSVRDGADILDTVTITEQDIVRIEYIWGESIVSQGTRMCFDILVIPELPAKEPITLYDVITQILSVIDTRRIDELEASNRIELAEVASGDRYVYAERLKKEIAPEFAFSKMTLWEIFSAIGGKLNAIPELICSPLGNMYQLYFRKLDSTELTPINYDTLNNVDKGIYSQVENQNIEQYCGKLDTDVENLIDTDNVDTPTIIEPSIGYYKTPRVETGIVVVEENQVKISTQFPIERLVKVECGELPDGTVVGDITKYVCESARYGSLSSFSTAYPSKATMIYYSYGQKDINGLTFKPELAWANTFGLGLFNYYTILRIISNAINRPLNALTQLFTSEYDLRNLMFRVSYIPRISARVKATKTIIDDATVGSTLTYNQGANLVSANYYGEALKGVVARYGNVGKNIVKITPSIQSIVGKGQVFRYDSKYKVSAVNTEWYPEFVKQEIELSQNFNRYSQYVGANNFLRLFEVSEQQAIDRRTIYEEYLVFTYEDKVLTSTPITLGTGMTKLLLGAITNNYSTSKIDKIVFRGYAKNDKIIRDYISLPAISTGIGNSLYIGCECADNYSAGDRIVTSLGQLNNNPHYFDAQQYVPYTDYYGDIYSLEFIVGYCDSSFDNQEPNYNSSWSVANEIPSRFLNSTGYFMATGTNKRLLLLKDSREIMKLAVQIHFVQDKNCDIIIGGALADNNGMTKIGVSNVALYVLDEKISNFTDYIDISGLDSMYEFQESDIEDLGNKWKIEDIVSTKSGRSWAIINRDNNRIVLAKNVDISIGDTIKMPYAYTERKIIN